MLIKQKTIQILLVLLLIILCAFATSPLSAHAQEATTEPENIGVSAICPDEADESEEPQIQPNSASRPTKVWNLATRGNITSRVLSKMQEKPFIRIINSKGKPTIPLSLKILEIQS